MSANISGERCQHENCENWLGGVNSISLCLTKNGMESTASLIMGLSQYIEDYKGSALVNEKGELPDTLKSSLETWAMRGKARQLFAIPQEELSKIDHDYNYATFMVVHTLARHFNRYMGEMNEEQRAARKILSFYRDLDATVGTPFRLEAAGCAMRGAALLDDDHLWAIVDAVEVLNAFDVKRLLYQKVRVNVKWRWWSRGLIKDGKSFIILRD